MALRPSNTSTGHCRGKKEEEDGEDERKEGREADQVEETLRTLEGLSSFHDEQSVGNMLSLEVSTSHELMAR